MRVALVIGVSNYRRVDSLPSCERDAQAIDDLLNEARSFEHRLCLSGDLPAQDTKTRILSFLENFRGQRVSQVLFYFSGHGSLQDGSLLYLLSDFDEDRPRQTSIDNEEVDNWLRNLAPEVAVKITDCCNSGMSYVKDSTTIESAVARSKGQFSACYFLAASHADEVTYAGEKFSAFTEHVFVGLSARDLGAIRYKDLVDAVLDGYKDNSSQRPYVVQQGGMRDVFFEQTDETRSLLKKLVASEVVLKPEPVSEEPLARRSVVEVVEADAKGMISNEMAEACLAALRKSMEDLQIDEDLRDIYHLTSEFEKDWEADVENEEAIGKWINRSGGNLFAEAIEEEVKTRIPHHLLNPMDASMNPWGKIESKKEITGFTVTSKLSYDFIRLRLEPRYPNLDKYEAAFLLLWSRREAVLFWYATPLRATGWDEHQVPAGIKWNVIRFDTSGLGKIGVSVRGAFYVLEKMAKNGISQRFPSTNESS